MTWEVPDRTEDHYPEGACSCGADLADAADLGVARSFQQEEIPAAAAERVQHDLHSAKCACGKTHVAPRPAGVPDSALSIGPRLRALAVYLVVFQHVPVERCRQLIADVAGAAVSEGFIHSCLAKAASLAGEVVALIRALITASAVAGFDETTLRSGRPGEEVRPRRVHRAVLGVLAGHPQPGRHAGRGILPGFAGIVGPSTPAIRPARPAAAISAGSDPDRWCRSSTRPPSRSRSANTPSNRCSRSLAGMSSRSRTSAPSSRRPSTTSRIRPSRRSSATSISRWSRHCAAPPRSRSPTQKLKQAVDTMENGK